MMSPLVPCMWMLLSLVRGSELDHLSDIFVKECASSGRIALSSNFKVFLSWIDCYPHEVYSSESGSAQPYLEFFLNLLKRPAGFTALFQISMCQKLSLCVH